jgi:hypothetical protein
MKGFNIPPEDIHQVTDEPESVKGYPKGENNMQSADGNNALI